LKFEPNAEIGQKGVFFKGLSIVNRSYYAMVGPAAEQTRPLFHPLEQVIFAHFRIRLQGVMVNDERLVGIELFLNDK